MTKTLENAVARFGADVLAKLNDRSATGEPEDQLRGPLENLIADVNALIGKAGEGIKAIGEVRLPDLMTRPDYAVTRDGLIGFIEVKAPGKGSAPTAFPAKSADRLQWEKLKSLPNILYTDGNGFTLWRDGRRISSVYMQGDIRTAGEALTAGNALLDLFSTFYDWSPIEPKKPQQLAETAARLCRLLRAQVVEQLARNEPRLTSLKVDWGKLLFPEADNDEFADGYAQAVTFGLLMARARDIPLTENIEPAAKALRQTNTLIGSALALFTEEPDEGHPLATSLRTLARVLGNVNWHAISKDDPEAWLYFYELFLQQYDTALRKKTGSYYTPPEVVSAMVSLVDQALRSPARFGLHRGLAASGITLADPAVGTGTFLLGVLRRIAKTIDADEGEGARPAAIVAALKRLVGFEIQFGPFAVAQLRLFAEVVDLTTPAAVDLKFQELGGMTIDDEAWVEAPAEWRAPFLPAGAAVWVSYPALEDLFEYNGSGVMTGRTWVIAPDPESLRGRWKRLRDEPDAGMKAKLFHPHEGGDRTVTKVVREALSGYPHPGSSVAADRSDGAGVRHG